MTANGQRPTTRARFPARMPGATDSTSDAVCAPGRDQLATRRVPSGQGMDSEAVRARMVERLQALGGMEPAALQAMRAVPRHLFLEPGLAAQAYLDNALPIGHGQTISKPSVVARCASVVLHALGGRPARMLEVGTGCGYQAAVLSHIADEVYSVERVRALHELARRNLRALRVPNLRLLLGDGTEGAAAGAPFDAVVSAAASDDVPQAWLQQLRAGGVLVAPIGLPQRLMAYRRLAGNKVESWCVEDAHFVPLKSGIV